MQILIQPMWSKKEINSDSTYVILTAWVRAILKQRPDWGFVMPFPDKNSGYLYDDDGFYRTPGVVRVPQRISPRKMANIVSFDGMWYDRVFRHYGFDCVWNHTPEVAGALKNSGEGFFSNAGRPAILNAYEYIIHKTLPYPIDSIAHVMHAQCTGALSGDLNVFDSEYCQWMWLDNAGNLLQRGVVEDILENSKVLHLGVLTDEIFNHDRSENEVPVIIYNHRLQQYKNYQQTFDVLQELWGEGLRFKLVATSSTPDKIGRVASLPFGSVKLCATREEYLEVLQTGDLNTLNTVHETFCISAVESMACGQPVVAPNGLTFPEITGRMENGYPYLFKGPEDQKKMLRKLIIDADERKKWGRVLSNFVRERFTEDIWATEYIATIEKLCGPQTSFWPNPKPDSLEMVRGKIRKMNRQELRSLVSEIRHTRVGDRVPYSSQSLSPAKCLRLVRHTGGKVLLRAGKQIVHAA